jgi:hypothetical protein
MSPETQATMLAMLLDALLVDAMDLVANGSEPLIVVEGKFRRKRDFLPPTETIRSGETRSGLRDFDRIYALTPAEFWLKFTLTRLRRILHLEFKVGSARNNSQEPYQVLKLGDGKYWTEDFCLEDRSFPEMTG